MLSFLQKKIRLVKDISVAQREERASTCKTHSHHRKSRAGVVSLVRLCGAFDTDLFRVYRVVNYAILTATSVLFNAYFHAKESEEAEYVDMIRTGIQVLRQHTSSGSALGNASITINKLLEDEISYRTRTRSSGVAMDVSATASRGQKRNLDTADDGFENTHKLLKRLMVS